MHLSFTQQHYSIVVTGIGITLICISIVWAMNRTTPRTKIVVRHDPLGFDVELWTQSFGSSKN